MLSDETLARLHTIVIKAIDHAEDAIADNMEDDAKDWMAVARDAEHICRKQMWMKKHGDE